MQCPRCLNTDEEYFYHGERGWYCRRCISFGRAMLEESQTPVSLEEIQEGSEEYLLGYPLTPAQAIISSQCAQWIETKNVLLHCVCGAGKTELVVESIAKMLKEKKKVCFAIPRRQVVLELQERLANYFPNAKVVGVCCGHTQEIDGDLIVCTTHQLYRYYQAFDLLILDEPDAFPFRGNVVLHGIAQTSCKGRMIYLTATPDHMLLQKVRKGELQYLVLNKRPHGYPLPVPQIKHGILPIRVYYLHKWLKEHQNHPRILFVPTIAMANRFYQVFRWLEPCWVCTSQIEERDEIVEQFRHAKNGLMIATTVLERGVTIPNVTICVYHAEHPVFDQASLIQMAGRVGRTYEYPLGDVLFLTSGKSEMVDQCQKEVLRLNA